MCPAIFQQYIETAADIRVIVIGDQVFAIRIEGDEGYVRSNPGQWRQFGGTSKYRAEVVQLDLDFVEQAISFVRGLGLVFGAMDFIERSDGSWVFLEINPSGQFLFCEQWCSELPLLQAFASMLAQGTSSYKMDMKSDCVSLEAFLNSPGYSRFLQSTPRNYDNLTAMDA